MSTTGVDSWAVNIAEVGPIYPFVGSEGLMVFIGLVFWLGFHVWQIRSENAKLSGESQAVREGRVKPEDL